MGQVLESLGSLGRVSLSLGMWQEENCLGKGPGAHLCGTALEQTPVPLGSHTEQSPLILPLLGEMNPVCGVFERIEWVLSPGHWDFVFPFGPWEGLKLLAVPRCSSLPFPGNLSFLEMLSLKGSQIVEREFRWEWECGVRIDKLLCNFVELKFQCNLKAFPCSVLIYANHLDLFPMF